jgi:hypothetical protein
MMAENPSACSKVNCMCVCVCVWISDSAVIGCSPEV